MNTRITTVSTKLRRWFVAGVAAVLALAWTITSLVTPGSAQDSASGRSGQAPVVQEKINWSQMDLQQASMRWGGDDLSNAAVLPYSPPRGQAYAVRVKEVYYGGTPSRFYWNGYYWRLDSTGDFYLPIDPRTGEGMRSTLMTLPGFGTGTAIIWNTYANKGIVNICKTNSPQYCWGRDGYGRPYPTSSAYATWRYAMPNSFYSTYTHNGRQTRAYCVEPQYEGQRSGYYETESLQAGYTYDPDGLRGDKNANVSTNQKLIIALTSFDGQQLGSIRINSAMIQAAIWRIAWGDDVVWKAYNTNVDDQLLDALIAAAKKKVAQGVADARTMLNSIKLTTQLVSSDGSYNIYRVGLKASSELDLNNVTVEVNGVAYNAQDLYDGGVRIRVRADACERGQKIVTASFHGSIKVPAVFLNGTYASGQSKQTTFQNRIIPGGKVEVTGSTSVGCPPAGNFTITKSFADHSAYSNDSKKFTFNVQCGLQSPKKVTVSADKPYVSGRYPVGTQCTVSEDSDSAAVPNYSYKGVAYSGWGVDDNEDGSASFTIEENGPRQNPAINVRATNDYVKPSLQTAASVASENGLQVGKRTAVTDRVTVSNVMCDRPYTLGGYFVKKSDPSVRTGMETYTFTPDQLDDYVDNYDGTCNATIDMSGSNWYVTAENSADKWVAFEYLWQGRSAGNEKNAVASHDKLSAQSQTVTPTPEGSFTVQKLLSVDGKDKVASQPDGVGKWSFQYRCHAPNKDFGDWQVLGSAAAGKTITNGQSYPVGTVCQVREMDNKDLGNYSVAKPVTWENADVVDGVAQFSIDRADQSVAVKAHNYLKKNVGTFSITKNVNGAQTGDRSFVFDVDCGKGKPGKVSVAAGKTWTSDEYPVGTTCSIKEDKASAASVPGVSFAGSHLSTTSVVIGGSDGTQRNVAVTAENTYATPALGTRADVVSGGMTVGKVSTLKDTVSFTNLQIGKTYTVKGYFVDTKNTGKPATKEVTDTFVASNKTLKNAKVQGTLISGDRDMTGFSVTPEKDQQFVAFEYLYEGKTAQGTPVAKHDNPKDKEQTVSAGPMGKFSVTKKAVMDGRTGEKKIPLDDAVFKVSVQCGDGDAKEIELKNGETYTSADLPVGTTCHVVEDKPLLHTSGASFKGVTYKGGKASSKGGVDVTIVKGDKPAVNVEVVNEYDRPTVKTHATTPAGPSSTVKNGADDPVDYVKVTDNVAYTNLIVGKTYTVQGHLVYQSGKAEGTVVKGVKAGEGAAQVNDTTISTTFKAVKRNGSVDLHFLVPASALRTAPLVVFEDLKYGDVTVANHHDITDKHQTVGDVRFAINKTVDASGVVGNANELLNGTYNFTATCVDDAKGTKSVQNVAVKVKNGKGTSSQEILASPGQRCTIEENDTVSGSAYTNKVTFTKSDIPGVSVGKDQQGKPQLVVNVTDKNRGQLDAVSFDVKNTVTSNVGTFAATKKSVDTQGILSNLTVPKTFEFEYKCPGDTSWKSMGSVAKGETTKPVTQPVGTVCQVRERTDRAQVAGATLTTTYQVNGVDAPVTGDNAVLVTVGKAGSTVTVAANNAYREELGGFKLAKTASVGHNAAGLDTVNYHLKYTCSKGSTWSKTDKVTVKANGPAVDVTGIPLGASCSVTEVDRPTAPATVASLTWLKNGVPVAADSNNAVSFTVNGQPSAVTVTANNVYTDKKAGFAISKLIAGTAINKPDQNKEFSFTYSCINGSQTISGSFVASQAHGWQSSSDDKLKYLRPGASCTVKEIAPKGAPANAQWQGVDFQRVSASGNFTTGKNSVTFTVPEGQTPIQFRAVNTYNQEKGSLKVTKKVQAKDVDNLPGGYTFRLNCTDSNGHAIAVDPQTRTVSAGGSAEWSDLPVGATCKVTEDSVKVPGDASMTKMWSVDGANATTGEFASVTIGKNKEASVILTNKFDNRYGSFTVVKRSATVTGDVADGQIKPKAPTSFHFQYSCDNGASWTDMKTIGVGQAAASGPVKANSVCTIREAKDAMPARNVTWYVDGQEQPGGDSTTVTVKPDQKVAVVVDNVYPLKPEIGTTLADLAGSKQIPSDAKSVVLRDTVSYYNLDTTKEYTVTGQLMAPNGDKTSATPTGIVGSSKKFRPASPNGTVTVDFTVDRATLEKHPELVAYEQLKIGGTIIAKHENPKDKKQTVTVKPSIGTTLTGKDGKAKTFDRPVDPNATVTFVDRVEYKNLEVGKYYRLAGQLKGDSGETVAQTVLAKPFYAKAPANDPSARFVSGTVDMKFTVSGSVLQANTKLVAFEQLWDDSKIVVKAGKVTPVSEDEGARPVAVHEDMNSVSQTVKANPAVSTYATFVGADGDGTLAKEANIEGKGGQTIKLNDRLTWYNLPVGTYVAFAGLHDASSGVKYDGTKAFDGTVEFTVSKGQRTGTVNVPLSLTIHKDQQGKTKLVVFDSIFKKSDVADGVPADKAQPVAVHEDASDTNQQVSFTVTPPAAPEGKITVKKIARKEDGTSKGLPQGTKYGFEFSCDGIANRAPAKPEYFSLENEQVHTVSTTVLEGQKCHVTEVGPVAGDYVPGTGWVRQPIKGMDWKKLSWTMNGEKPVEENIAGTPANDSQHTFTFSVPKLAEDTPTNIALTATNTFVEQPKPKIRTQASDVADGDKMVQAAEDAVVRDVVTYNNLIRGKTYTVSGTLHRNEKGQDSGSLSTVTPGEGCLVDGKAVPGVECKAGEEPGSVSLTFKAPNATGSVELRFRVPGQELKVGKPIVAFEKLLENKKPIATHQNINDSSQTVTVVPAPKLATSAEDASNNNPQAGVDRTLEPGKPATIIDTVSYSNLKSGQPYTIIGSVHLKDGNEDAGPLTSAVAGGMCSVMNGDTTKAVTCEDLGNGQVAISFVPVGDAADGLASGHVQLSFTLPAKAVQPNTEFVVFERAYRGDDRDNPIAVHHNINDKNQTVKVSPQPPAGPTPEKPGIQTEATVGGAKTLPANVTQQVTDVVNLDNLNANTTYVVKGALHDKKTGKVLTGATAGTGCTFNGAPVACKNEGNGIVSITFRSPNGVATVKGTATLSFTVNGADLSAGRKLVAFEKLYESNGLQPVATHEDLKDAAQTVTVTKPTPGKVTPPPSTPGVPILAKTGASALLLAVLGAMALAIGGLVVWSSPARRRVRDSKN